METKIYFQAMGQKTDHKYSITRLLESLSKAKCSHIQQNYYLFDYYYDVLKDIGQKMKYPNPLACTGLGLLFN